MGAILIDQQHESLLSELGSPAGAAALRKLRRRVPSFGELDSWTDCGEFVRQNSHDHTATDPIFRAILIEREQDAGPIWGTALLFLQWLALRDLDARKAFYDDDEEERWQVTLFIHSKVVARHDVDKKPCRIARKIMNAVRAELTEHYVRDWRRRDREQVTDTGQCLKMADSAPARGTDQRDHADQLHDVGHLLRDAVTRGVIDDVDLFLLIGTHVYGNTLHACAHQAGLTYGAAKKRRRRAENRLRGWYSDGEFEGAPVPTDG